MANKLSTPYRLQFKFWLDITRSDEESIADIVEKLKTMRRYTAAIRDGLRLIWDLSQGKTDVLQELFPNVIQQIKEQGRAESAETVASTQFLSYIQQAAEAAASKTVAALESKREPVMVEAEHLPAPASSGGLKPLGGLKTIAVAPVMPPSFDDDDSDFGLTVTKAENSGSNAAQNLINSLMALQKPKST